MPSLSPSKSGARLNMARAFAINQQINGTTTVAKNLTNFSMAGWMRRTSTTLQAFGFTETNSHAAYIWHASNNIIYFGVSNGAYTYSQATQNVTGWNHWLFTFDGSQTGNSNRLKAYLNGVQLTLSFTGTVPSATSNNVAIEQFRIGRATYVNAWSTGDFAELGMWQATLTAEEVASSPKG